VNCNTTHYRAVSRRSEPIVAAMDMVVAVRAYSIQRSKWA